MIFILFIATFVLAGCRNDNPDREEKISIVITIFPEYDWAKNILTENVERADLSMLLDNGVDSHSYQPTVDDMVKISNCDLFLYVGGESDSWMADALKNPKNPNRKTSNLLEVLGDAVKTEESTQGMREHEHETQAREHEEKRMSTFGVPYAMPRRYALPLPRKSVLLPPMIRTCMLPVSCVPREKCFFWTNPWRDWIRR